MARTFKALGQLRTDEQVEIDREAEMQRKREMMLEVSQAISANLRREEARRDANSLPADSAQGE